MYAEELYKLYHLRGTLTAQYDFLVTLGKNANDHAKNLRDDWERGYYAGLANGYAMALKYHQRALAEISELIEEAGHGPE